MSIYSYRLVSPAFTVINLENALYVLFTKRAGVLYRIYEYMFILQNHHQRNMKSKFQSNTAIEPEKYEFKSRSSQRIFRWFDCSVRLKFAFHMLIYELLMVFEFINECITTLLFSIR